jgi:hypothetical protein
MNTLRFRQIRDAYTYLHTYLYFRSYTYTHMYYPYILYIRSTSGAWDSNGPGYGAPEPWPRKQPRSAAPQLPNTYTYLDVSIHVSLLLVIYVHTHTHIYDPRVVRGGAGDSDGPGFCAPEPWPRKQPRSVSSQQPPDHWCVSLPRSPCALMPPAAPGRQSL